MVNTARASASASSAPASETSVEFGKDSPQFKALVKMFQSGEDNTKYLKAKNIPDSSPVPSCTGDSRPPNDRLVSTENPSPYFSNEDEYFFFNFKKGKKNLPIINLLYFIKKQKNHNSRTE